MRAFERRKIVSFENRAHLFVTEWLSLRAPSYVFVVFVDALSSDGFTFCDAIARSERKESNDCCSKATLTNGRSVDDPVCPYVLSTQVYLNKS